MTDRASGPWSAAHRLVTVAVIFLVTTIAFEAMAVSTAMPVVAQELDAVRSYGLAFSIMLTGELVGIVVSGMWSDQSGPVPPLILGQLLFAAGSVIAGLSVNFSMLLTGRLVTGLGAGLIIVALYVVIGRAYPEAVRPTVFSWLSAAWVLPALVGPPVAGVVTTTWSWRWVFLLAVVPVAVTYVVVLSRRRQIEGEAVAASAMHRSRSRTIAVTGVVVALSAGVMQVGAERIVPLNAAAIGATGLGLVGLAVAVPRLVPRGTHRMARGLPSVMASRFLLIGTFDGAMTFVPLMLVAERGLTPGLAGLMLSVGAVGWTLGSFIQANAAYADRKPALVSAGGGFLAGGILVLACVAAFDLPSLVVGVGAALSGLGMGLATASTSVLALSLSRPEEYGAAGSSLNISDVLGSVIGLSLAGAVFAALHDPSGSDAPVFLLMWAGLAGAALLVIPGGRRARP
ncbi:MAG: MFS transporter [Micrococcales bacterium]|nr:MFS transporter [Micrococcales bacterium]